MKKLIDKIKRHISRQLMGPAYYDLLEEKYEMQDIVKKDPNFMNYMKLSHVYLRLQNACAIKMQYENQRNFVWNKSWAEIYHKRYLECREKAIKIQNEI